jgi:hypothetical protein
MWDYPLSHIVTHEKKTPDRIWLGFCMNPFLGFRPFDEQYEYLPAFYQNCDINNIPILAHCSPDGFITNDAKLYKEFDIKVYIDRIKESKNSNRKAYCSNDYCGRERIVKDIDIDHFYRNYGHPRNWIPVLKRWPNLRLCFAHFGGNSEWGRESMDKWAKINAQNAKTTAMPPLREWISCIIKLTKYYKNVYADISGLNIKNDAVRDNLKGMLHAICERKDFEHLKYKLIFGSNGYFLSTNPTYDSYSEYCTAFKNLFYGIDKYGKKTVNKNMEELWERVSLRNPWNFYGLSLAKIQIIYSALPQLASKLNVDFPQSMANATLDACQEQYLPPFFNYEPAKQETIDEELEPLAGKTSCGLNRNEITCKNCGIAYRGEIKCTTMNNSMYGPIYYGKLSIEDFSGWDTLMKDTTFKLTEEEKQIIIGVSKNEGGKFDAVHSYDSKIVTVGVMQKTLDKNGFDQFALQLAEFSKDWRGKDNDKFKQLFENCGWKLDTDNPLLKELYDVKRENEYEYRLLRKQALYANTGLKAFYEYRDRNGNIQKITGDSLKRKIIEGFGQHNYNKNVECIPIEPLINAAKDPDFQVRQIKDFVLALRDLFYFNKEHPKQNILYMGYPLRDYLKSTLGKAMVLDQHVNRPGHVKEDIEKALKIFYQENSTIPTDPNKWGKKHEAYEKDFIGCYADIRRGTDMGNNDGREEDKRYKKLQKYLSKK